MARRDSWFSVGMDAWSLGFEASMVVGLRTMKLAAGGAGAGEEAHRMVAEKVDAALALQTLALSGGLGATAEGAAATTLSHYRTRVQANQRRLIKG